MFFGLFFCFFLTVICNTCQIYMKLESYLEIIIIEVKLSSWTICLSILSQKILLINVVIVKLQKGPMGRNCLLQVDLTIARIRRAYHRFAFQSFLLWCHMKHSRHKLPLSVLIRRNSVHSLFSFSFIVSSCSHSESSFLLLSQGVFPFLAQRNSFFFFF